MSRRSHRGLSNAAVRRWASGLESGSAGYSDNSRLESDFAYQPVACATRVARRACVLFPTSLSSACRRGSKPCSTESDFAS